MSVDVTRILDCNLVGHGQTRPSFSLMNRFESYSHCSSAPFDLTNLTRTFFFATPKFLGGAKAIGTLMLACVGVSPYHGPVANSVEFEGWGWFFLVDRFLSAAALVGFFGD